LLTIKNLCHTNESPSLMYVIFVLHCADGEMPWDS
jgi:hypothetical protein